MKEHPSILDELKDLKHEVALAIEEEDIETALAFIEQFILLEADGAFSAQSDVMKQAVWDVNAPTVLLDEKKIIHRARMKAYTDPDFGAGAVMPLLDDTGTSFKKEPFAVLAYLKPGHALTVRKSEGACYFAHHKSPETLRGGADMTMCVGVSLSEQHHGELQIFPAEPYVVMATSDWVAALPAEKENFSLTILDGGYLYVLEG